MVIAVVNALVWSLITPAFQTPDEPVQAGYVQWVAETGHCRSSSPTTGTARPRRTPPSPASRSPSSGGRVGRPRATVQLEQRLASGLGRTAPTEAGYASALPPLYFLLETIPYRARLGRKLLRPPLRDACPVGAAGRADRRLRLPVPSRAAAPAAACVDRRCACRCPSSPSLPSSRGESTTTICSGSTVPH